MCEGSLKKTRETKYWLNVSCVDHCIYICAVEEQHLDILTRIAHVFMRLGMRSVTMDDVARELKVSKKTIYKYVKDKEDLIAQALQHHLLQEEWMFADISGRSQNAIEEMVQIIKNVMVMLQQIHPSIHYDMEKYYPKAWDVLQEHKEKNIYGNILSNLNRGIKEGYYRDNLNPDIIARMYAISADRVFDGTVFPITEYKFTEVYLEYVRYHIRGIASKKGVKYLSELMNKEEIIL